MNLPKADPQGRRKAQYAVRIIRLLVLMLVGVAMVVGSIVTWNSDGMGNATGWFSQHRGPHGNNIGGLMIGGIFALLAGLWLVRTILRMRAERAAGLLPPR